MPTVTATSATDSVATSSSTADDANAICSVCRVRAPVAVGDRADRRRLRLGPAEGHQRRQAAHHVEEVARQRRQRPPLQPGAVPGREADQDPEDRDQRQRDQHDQRAHRVLGGDRDQGHARAARRPAPAPGRSGSGRARPRSRPGSRGWRARPSTCPLPRRAGSRRPPDGVRRSRRPRPRARPSCRWSSRSSARAAKTAHDHHRPGPHRAVVERGEDQLGDRPRLADEQQARDDAGRQHDGELPPRGRQLPAYARVAGSQRRSAGSGSWWSEMWCTEIRLRKIQ